MCVSSTAHSRFAPQIQPDTHVYEGELEQALIDLKMGKLIGLQHCKCGMSWKKNEGFFERTPDMVFALERKTMGKKVKQVPVVKRKIVSK